MGVEIRQFEKIRDKVEIRLDSHQIGWLVAGCLVIAGMVFAAGFQVGQGSATAATPPPTTGILVKQDATDKATEEKAKAPAEKAEPADPDEPKPQLRYTYDSVLSAPTPAAEVDDPTLKYIAAAMKNDRNAPNAPKRAATAFADAELAALAEKRAKPAQLDDDPTMDKPLELGELSPEAKPAKVVAPVESPTLAAAPAVIRLGAPKGKASKQRKPTVAAAMSSKYTIQIKAFRKRGEARQFLAALREAGYRPYLVAADIPGKGRFYRVRLGKFESLPEAETRQSAFEKAEGFKTILQPL